MNDQTSISERAVSASSLHRQEMRAMELGLASNRFYDAMLRAMKDIPLVVENTKKSGKGNAKYAPLDVLLKAVQPILLEHGIMIRQGQERSYGADDGGTKTRIYPIYTDLIHAASGEMHRTTIEIPAPRMDAQGVGSAITYGKRYSLLAALGIATDDNVDDDGEAARKREVTDEIHESQTLQQLKAAIDMIVKAGSIEKLKAFSVGEAGQKLSGEEFGALRTYWQQANQAIKKMNEASK